MKLNKSGIVEVLVVVKIFVLIVGLYTIWRWYQEEKVIENSIEMFEDINNKIIPPLLEGLSPQLKNGYENALLKLKENIHSAKTANALIEYFKVLEKILQEVSQNCSKKCNTHNMLRKSNFEKISYGENFKGLKNFFAVGNNGKSTN
ncbi:MAG TPA: hypothetical protein ENF67_00050 [Candidatus Pacearchaeota archaeon]|nr:hypothetical protein [Candidatus Pacearchaeota archaeon]